jgi:hypothetical protein
MYGWEEGDDHRGIGSVASGDEEGIGVVDETAFSK